MPPKVQPKPRFHIDITPLPYPSRKRTHEWAVFEWRKGDWPNQPEDYRLLKVPSSSDRFVRQQYAEGEAASFGEAARKAAAAVGRAVADGIHESLIESFKDQSTVQWEGNA